MGTLRENVASWVTLRESMPAGFAVSGSDEDTV